MADKKKALVIFDLDETLIHARPDPLTRQPDFIIEPLSVYFRPYVAELMQTVSNRFEVAVWSAGSPVYVETIVNRILPSDVKPVFVWNRDHCTRKFDFSFFQTLFLKDLNKARHFGFDLTNTLIIEDDPVKVREFSSNAIIVNRYYGEEGDDELKHLVDFIDSINGVDDLRKIDKNWKKLPVQD